MRRRSFLKALSALVPAALLVGKESAEEPRTAVEEAALKHAETLGFPPDHELVMLEPNIGMWLPTEEMEYGLDRHSDAEYYRMRVEHTDPLGNINVSFYDECGRMIDNEMTALTRYVRHRYFGKE